jgi:RHS repeat-associated protein
MVPQRTPACQAAAQIGRRLGQHPGGRRAQRYGHSGGNQRLSKRSGDPPQAGYPFGLQMPGKKVNMAMDKPVKEGFTGKERDKHSGLDYFGARYYDAGIGKWLSVDPLAEKYYAYGGYVYTLNNPISLIDPNGMEVVGDTSDLKVLADQLNKWIKEHGIKDAMVSFEEAYTADGNKYYRLSTNGTGWNDLASGSQSVQGLTMKLPYTNESANSIATKGLIHLDEMIRSETTIDFLYGSETSDGVKTQGGGLNSKGIHVAVDKGENLGVVMHELVGHGHPAYNSGQENDLGAVFGDYSRSSFHDAKYGDHWSDNGLILGGGYAGKYSRKYVLWGQVKPSFKMPRKRPF